MIDRILLALLAALSSSGLRHHRLVTRMVHASTLCVQDDRAPSGQDGARLDIVSQDHVSQDDGPHDNGLHNNGPQDNGRQQLATVVVAPHVTRAVSRATQVGSLGALLMVMWWSWPSTQGSIAQSVAVDATAATETATAAATASTLETPLAIVNPANVAGQVPASPTTAAAIPAAAIPAGVQPALVSMPNLAGQERVAPTPSAEADGAADTTTTQNANVAGNSQPTRSSNLPAVLPIAAEGTISERTAPEIVVIASAPQGAVEAYLIPTPVGSPTPTPDIPFVKIVTVPGFALPDGVERATPTPTPTPTPVPVALAPGRLWSNFVPKSSAESTHFWIDRPFPALLGDKIASPSYQFGSTAGGRYRIHHGMDISSPQGSPVRAAVAGEVVHAGWDDPALLGPYGGFYGNAVVIRLDRRLPVAGGELDVFLLYGHLSEVTTTVGERVDIDDIVGRVGMTGIAIGPHLHVEVRIGANSYENSVNPYLWVKPINNGGAVAVRLLSADGRTWPGARLTLARFEGSSAVWARQIEIYQRTEDIGPDPAWGENGAMGSVPPGNYHLIGQVNGETIRTELQVRAGETTFVELRTVQ